MRYGRGDRASATLVPNNEPLATDREARKDVLVFAAHFPYRISESPATGGLSREMHES